jgi:multiple antibiotic resistance protein
MSPCPNFSADLHYFIGAFVLLLAAINPLAVAALFLSMTGNYTRRQRESMAHNASWIALGFLLVFAVCGEGILATLGINIPPFRIAGGLLLAAIGFGMLRAEDVDAPAENDPSVTYGRGRANLSITPLAVPIIAGPGAASATILKASEAHGWCEWIMLFFAILFAVSIVYVLLMFAARGARLLGQAAMKLIFRIAGLVLLALAVQFVLRGLEQSEPFASLFSR